MNIKNKNVICLFFIVLSVGLSIHLFSLVESLNTKIDVFYTEKIVERIDYSKLEISGDIITIINIEDIGNLVSQEIIDVIKNENSSEFEYIDTLGTKYKLSIYSNIFGENEKFISRKSFDVLIKDKYTSQFIPDNEKSESSISVIPQKIDGLYSELLSDSILYFLLLVAMAIIAIVLLMFWIFMNVEYYAYSRRKK